MKTLFTEINVLSAFREIKEIFPSIEILLGFNEKALVNALVHYLRIILKETVIGGILFAEFGMIIVEYMPRILDKIILSINPFTLLLDCYSSL